MVKVADEVHIACFGMHLAACKCILMWMSFMFFCFVFNNAVHYFPKEACSMPAHSCSEVKFY